jgi:thioredoxin-like negative regulator of GroEL
MPIRSSRTALLFPLVTAAALAYPSGAAAADPVAWRTDYNAARKEATEKGLPLFVVVGSDDCFYCRKLEGGPLRDPAVAAQLAGNFVSLKIDATRDPNLAKALRVQLYPTIVLAAPDGKIHSFIEGYLDADRLNDQLKRAVTATTTTDWAARDFDQATKALAAGEYPRAVTLLKAITREAGEKPVGVKAKQVLEDVEKLAAARLTRAKELEQRGLTQEALDTLAEAVKTYAGTQAAADAATLMTGLAAKPETREKLRQRAARDLLAAAKEEFRTNKFYDCLQKCDQLSAGYGDLSEGKEGAALAWEVKNNPERLAAACEQMNERTAAMYMTLAEAWAKKGQAVEAIACYEKVTKLCPNSRQADIALAQVTKLRANGNAIPTGGVKP